MARFLVGVVLMFAAAFTSVTWARRGFPMGFSDGGTGVVAQMQPTIESRFGEPNPKQREIDDKEAAFRTKRYADDGKLADVRTEVMQAANGYAASPCNDDNKKRLIAALSTYGRMYMSTLNCSAAAGIFGRCSDDNFDEAKVRFRTPMDLRIKESLNEAFSQKGIMKSDFAPDVQIAAATFGGPELWNNDSPVCIALMTRAARTQ